MTKLELSCCKKAPLPKRGRLKTWRYCIGVRRNCGSDRSVERVLAARSAKRSSFKRRERLMFGDTHKTSEARLRERNLRDWIGKVYSSQDWCGFPWQQSGRSMLMLNDSGGLDLVTLNLKKLAKLMNCEVSDLPKRDSIIDDIFDTEQGFELHQVIFEAKRVITLVDEDGDEFKPEYPVPLM
jgi:hypothetical protein